MKAVIYARYSSDNQREESIDAQLRACRDYCRRQDWDVAGEYIDQALTATSDDRPEFQRMVYDSLGAKWDYVVVHKLDRFARNRYDAAIYKKKLRINGARLVSVLESLDDSPESIIMESVLQGMAEYYSANLSREVKKGLRENAYQAKTTGGFPPLGYDLDDDGHYIINEKEAAIVRLIFSWVREGMGYKKIAARLNTMGAVTKLGRPFASNSIHDILRNEKYRGLLVYNRFKRGEDGKVKRHALGGNDDTIQMPGGIPAIVPEADWFAINEAMDARKVNYRNTVDNSPYLLTGKVFCGLCGGAMTGHRSNSIRYYRCNLGARHRTCKMPIVACSKVDEAVLNMLRDNILNPAAIDEIMPAIHRKAAVMVKEAGLDFEALRERLEAIEPEIRKIIEAIKAIGISDSLKAELLRLEAEKKTALLAMADAEAQARKYSVNPEGIREMLERDMQALDEKDPNDLVRLIGTYVSRVVIYPPEDTGRRKGHKVDISLQIFSKKHEGGDGSPPNVCSSGTPKLVHELHTFSYL